MIALILTLALSPLQDDPPTLAAVVGVAMERCLDAEIDASLSGMQHPEAQDASLVVVQISEHGCSLSAEGWTADDGELIDRVWIVVHGAPAWSAEEVRILRVNERGPAQWTRFVQQSADGDEIARVTIIEPAAGRSDSFSLLYQVDPRP